MYIPPRTLFILLALGCAGLLGYGYYLQFVDGLEPCPMCIFQRLCYMAIIGVSIVAAVHGGGRVATGVYTIVVALVGSVGAAIAARQTWLQHLPPDQVPECGPGLDFMLEMYPLGETILKTLKGTGDCATVDWRFLGLSIAEWSLLCFIAIVLIVVVNFFASRGAYRNSGRGSGSE